MGKSSVSCALSQVPAQAQPLTSMLHELRALLLRAESSVNMNSCTSWVVPASAGSYGAAPSSPVRARDETDAAAQGAKEREKLQSGEDTRTARARIGEQETALVWGLRHLWILWEKYLPLWENRKAAKLADTVYRHFCALSAVAARAGGGPRRGYKKHAVGSCGKCLSTFSPSGLSTVPWGTRTLKSHCLFVSCHMQFSCLWKQNVGHLGASYYLQIAKIKDWEKQ